MSEEKEAVGLAWLRNKVPGIHTGGKVAKGGGAGPSLEGALATEDR